VDISTTSSQQAGWQVSICIDPQHLNKALKRSHYRMEMIQDVLPKLRQAKVFSTIDIKKAFLMVQVDEQSSHLTTFDYTAPD